MHTQDLHEDKHAGANVAKAVGILVVVMLGLILLANAII